MKTLKQLLVLSLMTIIIATGCKKYEEGPGFSLRSKTARVSNEWKVDHALEHKTGLIVTADYAGETWEFTKDGEFVERDNGIAGSKGTWEFSNDKEAILVKMGVDTLQFSVIRLKENEMWLKDAEEELRLVPAN